MGFLPGQGSACTAPPGWLAGREPTRMGQGPFLEIGPPDFTAFNDAHLLCIYPDLPRHLVPNCSFSVHNPNHREMTDIREIF